MKRFLPLLMIAGASLFTSSAKAQTTAMDFNILDCNGNPHHLFDDLDAGKAVIIEFFMNNCTPCVTAGQKLEAMKTDLLTEYPGMIKSYAFGYNNSYTCTVVNNWVNNNGFTSVPSDSGAAQVAHYGGMGMPTIVIVGGTSHSVLGSPYIGFSTSDTTTMAADIRSFFSSMAVNEASQPVSINMFPNPANTEVKLSFTLKQSSEVKIDVVDITGRIVTEVMNERSINGEIAATINTSKIAQGTYMVRINANGVVSQQKLTVVH